MQKNLRSAYAFFFLIGLLFLLPYCKKPETMEPIPDPAGENFTNEERLAVMEAVENTFTTLINIDRSTALPQLPSQGRTTQINFHFNCGKRKTEMLSAYNVCIR